MTWDFWDNNKKCSTSITWRQFIIIDSFLFVSFKLAHMQETERESG
jgi:hypothetical protein